MAFNIKDTLDVIHGYLVASGHVTRAQVGEPKSPPTEFLTGAVFMLSTVITKAYLQTQEESHVVQVRLYIDMLHEPTEEIEFRLALAVAEIVDDLIGDFSLGANIREVDIAGMNGTPLATTWGYVGISQRIYRIVDITLPLNVDNAVAAVA